ncbi:MAG: 8-oxoguanine deaminase [Gammaproteobacteria bacterium]|nr:8-oxoguanine deaminase [Gammaproteobacteria bacterium]
MNNDVTLLVKNAAVVVTMDDQRQEITDGALFVRDNVIEQVGPTDLLPSTADEVLDLSGHIVLPGLVNTHHHMYQTLTRCVAQEADLFTWLKTLYPIWSNLTDEGVYISTKTAIAELLLSGCTTSSDHLYLYPNNCTLDSQVRAAQETGMRFHAARGSMSLGESDGGLPPDNIVERDDDILRDSQRVIEQYHDADRHAMTRIVLAPCTPFSVTMDLMRETATLAREHSVGLHSHICETVEEEQYCLEHFGKRPVDYLADLGWLADDTWHAHCIHLIHDEVNRFAATGTGVAHCPSSNLRLGSGIAPLRAFLDSGVSTGLGVDGSASNDGNHMLGEARMAMLANRVRSNEVDDLQITPNAAAITARQALEVATRGGAKVLGRDDIGHLAPGMSADFIAINLNRLEFTGALHDPVSALLFCDVKNVDYLIVNGKMLVQSGQLLSIDALPLIEKHNAVSRKMMNGD